MKDAQSLVRETGLLYLLQYYNKHKDVSGDCRVEFIIDRRRGNALNDLCDFLQGSKEKDKHVDMKHIVISGETTHV